MPIAIILAAAVCIANVHDGDTVRLCDGERVRLLGIDAPELPNSPRCSPKQRRRRAGSRNPPWCDFAAGEASRDALARYLRSGTVTIARSGADDYGRTLARLRVNDRDAGEYLISRGLAHRWR
jgi:endonuclease YncB( thermonuclease family)